MCSHWNVLLPQTLTNAHLWLWEVTPTKKSFLKISKSHNKTTANYLVSWGARSHWLQTLQAAFHKIVPGLSCSVWLIRNNLYNNLQKYAIEVQFLLSHFQIFAWTQILRKLRVFRFFYESCSGKELPSPKCCDSGTARNELTRFYCTVTHCQWPTFPSLKKPFLSYFSRRPLTPFHYIVFIISTTVFTSSQTFRFQQEKESTF